MIIDVDSPPIRTVTVEFVRKGPPHNQLLSPLTEYLGICGGSGAGSVSVPYEQAVFNVMLDDLRYVDSDEQDQAPRRRAVRRLGRDIGEMLGAVPGFTGSLAGGRSDSVVNLRIVTSASELALLPFELAMMPSSTGRSANELLVLQSATPVCVTRRSRSVGTGTAVWRGDKRPRVLFIVGLDISEDLASRHRDALLDALSPWDTVRIDGETFSEHCLVELSPFRGNTLPTIQAIRSELESGFTYVHILAHGAESEEAEALTYGLYLPAIDPDTKLASLDVADVVTGDRFASALSSIPREVWPSMVLTASCDSGNQGDLLIPGGSFGLALHEAGVPLVVASQFPLTVDGSVTLTEALYTELVWGVNPLRTLTRARATLHATEAIAHDWASVVIYDGTPDDLEDQAVRCRYMRSKTALGRAQDLLREPDRDTNIADPKALTELALELLPADVGYEREKQGLIASHAKMMAELSANNAEAVDAAPGAEAIKARGFLEQARHHYHRAARDFLDPGQAKQLDATLHWVLTQALSLDRLLGDSGSELGWSEDDVAAFGRTTEEQAWDLAFQSATVPAQSSPDEVWGHGSLMELWLLKLFEDLEPEGIGRAKRLAQHHATRIAQLSDASDPFPIFSTKRQLQRYAELWTPQFRALLKLDELDADQTRRWELVRSTARELIELLSRFDSTGPGTADEAD